MKTIGPMLALLFLLSGCDVDPTEPLAEGLLTGRVVDARGNGVPGASVTLLFGVDGAELPGWDATLRRARVSIDFALATESVVRLTVEDYVGEPVRLLLDSQLSAGSHSVFWDARDDGGRPVPPGVYRARLEVLGSTDPTLLVFERFLFLYDPDPVSLVDRAHAHTDARGEFVIPLAIAPLGEEVGEQAEFPEGIPWVISHRVRVVVSRRSAGEVESSSVDLYLTDREEPRRVEVLLGP